MFNKILSSLLVVLCIGAFAPQQATAQTEEDPTWLGVYAGHHQYDGDYTNEMMQYGIDHDVSGGVSLTQYLNPSFNVDYTLTLARLDDEYDNYSDPSIPEYFSMYAVNSNLSLQYKLSNGYIFKSYSTVQPYIKAGVGYSWYGRGTEPSNSSFQVPLGVGFNIPLGDNIMFVFDATYNRTLSDDIDGNTTLDSKDHDDYLVQSIGLKFKLGASKDTDGDGINDKNDACPTQIGDPQTNGCPDRDGDLVIDSEDRCPNQPGIAKFSGCPDTDADGIPDYEDQCPRIAGSAEFNGCKDTDSDGIADNMDNCPKVAGSEETAGCPDSDGDGVVNSIDRCPNVAGSKATAGCPDADMDGVMNENDACPELAGVASNNGCPVVSQEIKDAIDVIFNNLIFTTDKAVIHESSIDEMDKLVELMEDNPKLLLSIEGHTDTRGSAEYNRKLSQDRANAVKTYLVNAGISSSRITATGYGESRPLVSPEENDTDLARNRRVELIVSYQ